VIVAEMAQTLKIRQDKTSQHVTIDELVKKPDKNGRKWIAAEIAETLHLHQDKHLQRH